MNEIGYMSLSGMMKIPGIKFHQIKLDEDQPYMGAGSQLMMSLQELINLILMSC